VGQEVEGWGRRWRGGGGGGGVGEEVEGWGRKWRSMKFMKFMIYKNVFFRDENNDQQYTNRVARNFGGFRVGAAHHNLTPIPSAILGGTPTSGIFGTFLDTVTFPEYTKFNRALLYCGASPFT
jgi:hypothetical protein